MPRRIRALYRCKGEGRCANELVFSREEGSPAWRLEQCQAHSEVPDLGELVDPDPAGDSLFLRQSMSAVHAAFPERAAAVAKELAGRLTAQVTLDVTCGGCGATGWVRLLRKPGTAEWRERRRRLWSPELEEADRARRRIGEVVRRLRDEPFRAKRQGDLLEIAQAWTPLDPRPAARRWKPFVEPTAENVAVVAACVFDPVPETRRAAIGALTRAAAQRAHALEALIFALRDEVPLVRLGAVDALRVLRLGAEAAAALREALADPVWTVRWNAAAALAGTGAAEAALLALEVSAPSSLRALHGWLPALREFGPAARRFEPLLEHYSHRLESDTDESKELRVHLLAEIAYLRGRLAG